MDQEEKIKILEKKLDLITREKTELHKKMQKFDAERSDLERERNSLKETNLDIEDRLASYINQLSFPEKSDAVEVLKKEIQSKGEEIERIKNEKNHELDALRLELFSEKDIAREIGNNLEQKEMKIQHCETKIRNLEKSLKQKTKEIETSRIGSKHSPQDTEELENEIMKLRKEISLKDDRLRRVEEEKTSLTRELAEKTQLVHDHDILQGKI